MKTRFDKNMNGGIYLSIQLNIEYTNSKNEKRTPVRINSNEVQFSHQVNGRAMLRWITIKGFERWLLQ